MTDHPEPIRIDIVSDVVCPWCVIGYRQLAKALEDTGIAHEIHWHPFELNPDMPAEGQNLAEHLAEKYGSTPAQSAENRARITQFGAEVGFEFRFADDMRMHNTFNAHQLLHWANRQGRMHDLKQALFDAHFTARQDLSDAAVLADVAAGIGLDRAVALSVLGDQRFAPDVREEQNFWLRQGIRGVPAVVFDNKYLVTGAQGVVAYAGMLRQVMGKAA